jgi:ligand-binding sensor domain-containing protein/signal transduction histidine kinase
MAPCNLKHMPRHRTIRRPGRAAPGLRWPALLAILLSVLVCPETPAEYTLRRWGTDEGLPHGGVRAITRTRDGYLWVGTYSGLARFDGNAFTPFTVQNTPAFVSDQINKLVEDDSSNLWIATLEGLLRQHRGQFTRVDLPEPFANEPIHDLCLDSTGNLWVSSENRLLRRHENRSEFEIVEASPGGPVPGVRVIAAGTRGEIWIGGWDGLWRYSDGAFHRVPTSERVQRLAVDPAGNPWFVDTSWHFFGVTHGILVEPPQFAGREANSMAFAPSGELLLGTRSGELLKWTRETENLSRFDLGLPASYSRIRTVTCDADGPLWLGLDSGGLVYLRQRTVTMLGAAEGLPTPSVATIAQDESGQILVGTQGQGAFWFRDSRFVRTTLRQDILNVTSLAPGPDLNWGIGNIWGVLHRWNGATTVKIGRQTHARQVIIDDAGGYWVATASQGLEHMPASGDVRSYTTKDGLASDRTHCVLRDTQGTLWIGTQHGLSQFSNGTFRTFSISNGLRSDTIRCLLQDRAGQLWVGTQGGGLSAYWDGQFVSFTTRDGLVSDSVRQLVEDDHGHLWLGTAKGLMRLAIDELRRYLPAGGGPIHGATLSVSDGLAMREMGTGYQPSALKSSDGRLWFCSDSGLAVLDPNDQRSPVQKLKVQIEQTGIDGKLETAHGADGEGHLESGAWTIPPLSRNLEIRYTAVSFNAPERIRFKYRLLGHDPDWVTAGSRRTAYYSELRPANYRFEVIACNSDGVWNEEPTVLTLKVLPAFWQTDGFRVAVGLTSLAAVIAVVRFFSQRRLRQRLADLERRRAIEEERSRIAKDLHDELGASLTRIKLLGELVQRGASGSPESARHAQTISQTAQGLAQGMDEIVWALNPQKDRIESLAQYLAAFAEETLRDTDLRLRLDLPEAPSERPLPAPVRHQLFLAVKEALHNAVKHSGATEIRLSLREEDAWVRVVVVDNGSGLRPTDPAEHGNGLRNMRSRMDTIGGHCEVGSPPGGGVRVTFLVPVAGPPTSPAQVPRT